MISNRNPANRLAPINYYDRLFWLFGIISLAFLVLVIKIDVQPVTILFYLSLPFIFAWWVKVDEPERPPAHYYIARVGLGFILGLGGLMFIFWIAANLWKVTTLWQIPTITQEILLFGFISTTGMIWLQIAVGTVEEGIFRVALPRLMLARNINPFAVIILANWTFGLFHWKAYGGDVQALAISIFAGFLQSFAYFSSRSILGPMLGHAVWNMYAAGVLQGLIWYLSIGLLILGVLYWSKLKYRWRFPQLR